VFQFDPLKLGYGLSEFFLMQGSSEPVAPRISDEIINWEVLHYGFWHSETMQIS
jgi:hypothetical protein